MSKKFFRAPALHNNNDSESEGDDDEDLDDDDDEEEEERPKKSNAKRKKGGGGGGGKRPKKTSFFDMEAEASDGEDEDEDDDNELARYSGSKGAASRDAEQMDKEALEIMRQQDRRRAQASGNFLSSLEERSAAEISRDIEQRHRSMMHSSSRPLLAHRAPVPPVRRPVVPGATGGGGGASVASSRKGSAGPGGGGSSSAAGAKGASSLAKPSAAADNNDMEDDDEDFEESVGVSARGGGGGGMAMGEPGMGGPEVYTAVAQQSLVPSVSDPSLWMVSCATGKEQELVFQIMNKCISFARQGKPLGISAAIAAQSRGKIFLESFSEPAVMEAIQGVRGLLQYTMKLVPIGDMTTVMTVTSKKKPVKKNEWVRMTRGHYKGDLALVNDVKESGLKCIVQCVPRLDLSLADLPPEEARVRRKTIRPPQKFFNPQELAAMGRQSVTRQRFPGLSLYCDYFEGNYYHDGYLLKEMTVGNMIKQCTEEDQPTLDELQAFQRRAKSRNPGDPESGTGEDENEGSKLAGSLLDELSKLQNKTGLGQPSSIGATGLSIGDTVEVIEGDLIGMRGKLVSHDETSVKIKPNSASGLDLGTTEEVEFLASQVRKYIPVGAHVKVTDGRYANETGIVVAVEQMEGETDFTAVVLTDITNKEISVRTSQLRESAEVASGQDKLQGYELYDLVVLSGGGSANEVGVIVRVGREDFTVINNHGIAREVRPEELRGKRNSTSNKAMALDVQGNQIRVGDSVNVAEGPNKGKTATIKRMARAQLFLYSQTRTEHAGIFVVRSRSCVLAGSRTQNRSSGADGGVSPFATPQTQAGRGAPGGRGTKRDDGLIGKTVRIQAGQWKGYLGSVCDATATHVQVELHSRLRKVMVVRERVAVVGDKFGATEDPSRIVAVPQTATTIAPTTPYVAAGATPMHGGATPMHAGADDASDEVWRPGGAIDQEAGGSDGQRIKSDDGWGSSSHNQFGDDGDSGWGGGGGGGGTGGNGLKEESAWGSSSSGTKREDGGHSNSGGGSVVKQEDGVAAQREHHQQQTASEMEGDADESPGWFMERVCVQVKSSGKHGVIRETHANKTALVELEDGSSVTVRASELAMIAPSEHDTVLVTGGNEVGLEGSLVCVDGSDAILKDANDDFKIVEISFLAKVQPSDN